MGNWYASEKIYDIAVLGDGKSAKVLKQRNDNQICDFDRAPLDSMKDGLDGERIWGG